MRGLPSILSLFCNRFNRFINTGARTLDYIYYIYLYSKLSFGEVYRQIYGRKFSFTATREGGRKHDFRLYIRGYTSQNENFEYGYSHSTGLLHLKWNTVFRF